MTFRKAENSDFLKVLNLKNQVHKKHVVAEPEFYKDINNVMTEKAFLEEVENSHKYLLENANKIIGYIIYNLIEVTDNPVIYDQKIMFIDDFCIDEKEKCKGYGKYLFNEAMILGKKLGCKSIELNVWNFNREAKTFYYKMNMRETRIRMRRNIV
jgi:ribosomal protein S18 acetylase RimI-like enzyme